MFVFLIAIVVAIMVLRKYGHEIFGARSNLRGLILIGMGAALGGLAPFWPTDGVAYGALVGGFVSLVFVIRDAIRDIYRS